MMNEPHRGYIELPSLHEFDYNTDLHLSHVRKYKSFVSRITNLLIASSFCPPIFCTRFGSPNSRSDIHALVPNAHNTLITDPPQPKWCFSLEKRWSDKWGVYLGERGRLGMGQEEERASGIARKLFRDASTDRRLCMIVITLVCVQANRRLHRWTGTSITITHSWYDFRRWFNILQERRKLSLLKQYQTKYVFSKINCDCVA